MSENPWDKKALEYGASEIGAHSDEHLVELENDFIEKNLIKINPKTILDVGCGNGQRTKKWAEHARFTTGIDKSREMVSLARQLVDTFEQTHNEKLLSFFRGDVLNIGEKDIVKENTVNVIISARCLINLPTEEDQIAAINAIYNRLEPGGFFICCEGRAEGTKALNKLRDMFDVEPIKVMETNLDLSERVINRIWHLFGSEPRVQETTFGTYYLLTRVLTQIKNIDPKEVAKRLQLEYGDELGLCDMGRHFCFCGRKKGGK